MVPLIPVGLFCPYLVNAAEPEVDSLDEKGHAQKNCHRGNHVACSGWPAGLPQDVP